MPHSVPSWRVSLPGLLNDSTLTKLVICDVLGVTYPSIVRQQVSGNRYPHVYEVLAEFDHSHPYLNRASPIMLANVGNSDEKTSTEIAVKHIILRLLKIAKEDAGVSEKTYTSELRALSNIEGETKRCLDRQTQPSGTLSY